MAAAAARGTCARPLFHDSGGRGPVSLDENCNAGPHLSLRAEGEPPTVGAWLGLPMFANVQSCSRVANPVGAPKFDFADLGSKLLSQISQITKVQPAVYE